MLSNLNKPYPFFDDLSFNLKVIVGISLGMFLFILFFQPVDITGFEFNTKLMIIAGFGGIALVVLALNNIVMPSFLPRLFLKGNWKLYMDILLQLISWAMIAVAYNFYSRFVGNISIDFNISFRLILLALFPVVILIIINRFKIVRLSLRKLEDTMREAGIRSGGEKKDAEVTFESENKSEQFTVKLSAILFIQSANNYIEVFYLSGQDIHKQLIRSTLKRTEELLHRHSNILRSHRSILVNTDHAIRFTGNPGNLRLKLQHVDEDLPVSRQYLQAVKESIKGRKGK